MNLSNVSYTVGALSRALREGEKGKGGGPMQLLTRNLRRNVSHIGKNTLLHAEYGPRERGEPDVGTSPKES